MGDECILMAQDSLEPFKVMPWQVGQYVIYQITSFEQEDANNRYIISIIGQDKIDNEIYFWIKMDIYESIVRYGYNTASIEKEKNISFKALVPPLNSSSFAREPSYFISCGLFPAKALRLAVQIGDGEWHWVDPADFFAHEDIIEDTPYALTPHSKGRINFNKLKIDKKPVMINSPAGRFDCYHLSVNTNAKEKYWDEGFDLWRSAEVPILGLVKMEFSKTLYWEKWAYRHKPEIKNRLKYFFTSLYKKRVAGRRNPDTCIVTLIKYGQR